MSDVTMQCLASLATGKALRTIDQLCESQSRVGAWKLSTLVATARSELGECAFQLRKSHDTLLAERDQLRAELEAIRGQQPDTWPTLDKPAKVGPVRFNPGLSARLVVEAAQRQHEYSQQPEVEAARLERFGAFMQEVHGEQPDAVSVPRELLDKLLHAEAECLHGQFEEALESLRALSTKNAEERDDG